MSAIIHMHTCTNLKFAWIGMLPVICSFLPFLRDWYVFFHPLKYLLPMLIQTTYKLNLKEKDCDHICQNMSKTMAKNPGAQPWTVRGLVGVSRSRSETRTWGWNGCWVLFVNPNPNLCHTMNKTWTWKFSVSTTEHTIFHIETELRYWFTYMHMFKYMCSNFHINRLSHFYACVIPHYC